MSYKIIGYFAALLAVVRAGIIGPGATAVAVAQQPAATVIRAENYDSPRYSFEYSVADGLTGDNKAQEETRNGDAVHGSYSLIEPDGTRRVVSYAADPINGFNAVVQRDTPGITVKAAAVAAAAPLAVATVRPVAVVTPSVIAAAAPAAVAVRPQLQHPWKLFAALRCRLTENADGDAWCKRNLVQHYPKLPDLLNSNSESRMMVCPTRTVLSSPTVPCVASAGQQQQQQQQPVRKTIPLAQHSSTFVATRIELPVVDITCNYNSYRYKTLEESLKERYGANYPPGKVVLNYIQLNTPDSRSGNESDVGGDLLDPFNVNDTGTYSSSVSTKRETEYLNLLDHFVLRRRGRALTAGKFTETPSFADERTGSTSLELSYSHVGTWSQSTLRDSVAHEKESRSSGNQRPSKGTKYTQLRRSSRSPQSRRFPDFCNFNFCRLLTDVRKKKTYRILFLTNVPNISTEREIKSVNTIDAFRIRGRIRQERIWHRSFGDDPFRDNNRTRRYMRRGPPEYC
ncbi:uncharacterized protein LOC105829426 isoform X2 [Monomorium pharaonis]|uniref:uncharacterized protein LOC105829426 isoform X2 n=1 Tax=Monomorium pharaonis TaxID=307658 RepID=UPI001746DFA2|nr:uncharacterized protein LOC105829426 isoform X2 [Monomorium pharaonis]